MSDSTRFKKKISSNLKIVPIDRRDERANVLVRLQQSMCIAAIAIFNTHARARRPPNENKLPMTERRDGDQLFDQQGVARQALNRRDEKRNDVESLTFGLSV